MPSWSKRLWWGIPVLAILVLVIVLFGEGGSKRENGGKVAQAAPEPAVDRAPVRSTRRLPNVVFIYTDDQDEATFRRRYMPNTFRLLVDKGTLFTDSVTATPICCPSRVSYISGQYPHNSGVFSNNQGYPALTDPNSTTATWMQRAGYRTAWFGKYLQHYIRDRKPQEPAPGIDRWAVFYQSEYYGYTLFGDGEKTEYGERPRDYVTDVLTREAVDLVERSERPARPFYLTLNYLAPHGDDGEQNRRCEGLAVPARRDFGRYRNLELPRPPSFDEADISDKRAYPDSERIDRRLAKKLVEVHQCRVESLQAVDRGVREIVDAVRRTGQLDRTVFVLTSDNGLLLGEHRLKGKGIPYEEGIGVPLTMRVPARYLGSEPVPRVDELVANIDLAPTILDLAGAEPCVARDACRRLDGRSLAPLLGGRSGAWPSDRAVLIEGGGEKAKRCSYRGVRTANAVLIERTKEGPGQSCVTSSPPEVYDLRSDPFQLDNLTVTERESSSDLRTELQARLARLERCSGIEGRERRSDAPYCD